MLRIRIGLQSRLGLALGLILAGAIGLSPQSAQAATIDPNPIHEARGAGAPGGSLEADLYAISVEGNTAIFQLSVTTGTVTGLDISMLFDSFAAPTVLDFVTGASFAGSGIGGTASVAPGGSEAQFDFAGGIGPGQSSAQLVVTFALPIGIGYEGGVDFDNGYATTQFYSVAVPEPLALLLVGLSLGGFAFVRRAVR